MEPIKYTARGVQKGEITVSKTGFSQQAAVGQQWVVAGPEQDTVGKPRAGMTIWMSSSPSEPLPPGVELGG